MFVCHYITLCLKKHTLYIQYKEKNNMKKLLLLGLVTAGLTMNVNAAEMDVYGSINYMITNNDNASGTSVMKAENNGSSIGVNFSETVSEGTGITGFGTIEVGVDADDAGSDTFDSKLAFVGVDMGPLGAVSGGRQSHPNDGIAKTGVFNEFGNSAVFTYGSRSSNSIKYETEVGPLTVSSMVIIDGATGKDGIDVIDYSAGMDVGAVALAAGIANDEVNEITYTVASAGMDIGGIALNGTYSKKDNPGSTADLEGMEATASYSVADNTIHVGYGDKEGTATYMTYGIERDFTDALKGYAEYQQTDNEGSAVDTDQMAVGMKFSF